MSGLYGINEDCKANNHGPEWLRENSFQCSCGINIVSKIDQPERFNELYRDFIAVRVARKLMWDI